MSIGRNVVGINKCNTGGSLTIGSSQFHEHIRVWVHHTESQLVCFDFPDYFSDLFVSQIRSIALEMSFDELSNFLGQVRHAAMKTSLILLLLVKLINDLSIICENTEVTVRIIFPLIKIFIQPQFFLLCQIMPLFLLQFLFLFNSLPSSSNKNKPFSYCSNSPLFMFDDNFKSLNIFFQWALHLKNFFYKI